MRFKKIGIFLFSVIITTSFLPAESFADSSKSIKGEQILTVEKTKNWKADLKKEIEKNVKEKETKKKSYKVKDIKFKIVDTIKPEIKKIIKDLKEKKAPETISVEGKKYILKSADYKEDQVTHDVFYRNYVRKPSIPTEVAIKQNNVEYRGTLENTTKTISSTYNVPFSVPAKFYGNPETLVYDLKGVKVSARLAPTFEGYNSAVLNYLNLNSYTFRVDGGRWSSNYYTDSQGRTVRNAVFSGMRRSETYKATYKATTYTANAKYRLENGKDQITVKATYNLEKIKTGFSPVQMILIGVGILILTLAVVIILMILTRKIEEEEKRLY